MEATKNICYAKGENAGVNCVILQMVQEILLGLQEL